MSDISTQAHGILQHEKLLHAVLAHVQQPLLHIRSEAELAQLTDDVLDSKQIMQNASVSLQLIEYFLTWQRYALEGEPLIKQQAGVASVLHDAAAALRAINSSKAAQVELDVVGRPGPIMTNASLLQAGLGSLGIACTQATKPSDKVVFGIHKNRWGIVAGAYSPSLEAVQSKAFMAAVESNNTARQSLPMTSYTSMSGVVIADALFRQLGLSLRPARHKNMNGFAVTLSPSPQLALL